MRIGGLATGLDTDSVVKQMLARDQGRIDKVKGDKQVIEWKQEIYRDMIGGVNKFKSKYFDILNKGTYALSPDFFMGKAANVIGSDNGLVSIKPGNAANPGRYEVTVNKKAEGASVSGSLTTTSGEKATNKTTLEELGVTSPDGKLTIKAGNGQVVTIDVKKETTVGELLNKINNNASLKGKVNASFSEISGTFKIETVDTGASQKIEVGGSIIGNLGLNSGGGDKVVSSTAHDIFKPVMNSSQLKVGDVIATDATKLSELGFKGDVKFKITVNGVESIVSLTNDKTIADLRGEIEKSGLKTSITDGKISIEGNEGDSFKLDIDPNDASHDPKTFSFLGLGAGSSVSSTNVKTRVEYVTSSEGNASANMPSTGNININVGGTKISIALNGQTTGDFVNQLNAELAAKGVTGTTAKIEGGKFVLVGDATSEISADAAALTSLGFANRSSSKPGSDAEVKVKLPDGKEYTITNSKNNFTVDGMTFDIKSADPSSKTIFNIESNVDKAVENIKGIVDDYNKLIDGIAKTIYQRKQYNYRPLTEEQKKEMKEDEIKRWEEKCKEGLLRSDPALDSMLTNLRQAFYTKVEGVGLSLADIGIESSPDYTQRGKLEINEEKLRKALTDNPEGVSKLFTQDSDNKYDPDKGYGGNADRMNNVGIFQRIDDILKDAVRTTSNKNGRKGALIEIAGVKGDTSELKNGLTERIKSTEKQIDKLLKSMKEKENRLYAQFSRLETMMNNINAQSAWLNQQLGGMQ